MSTQINRLGKGLDALIPSVIPNTQLNIVQIPISKIKPNQFQPRHNFKPDALNELAQSIKQHGLAQPILVREIETGYELIVGERRLEACKMLDQETIPAIIKSITDQQSCEIALVENIDRENLNVIEIARSFQRLMEEFEHTQESLSVLFSRSRSSIANIIRLLKLPPSIQILIVDGKLSEGHGRTLIDFSHDEALSLQLANEMITKNYSVRQAEAYIQSFRKSKKKQSKQLHLFENYVVKLTKNLNTNVEIKHRKNRLSITVQYDKFKDYIYFLDQLCTIEMSEEQP